jgi:hypothetical protein
MLIQRLGVVDSDFTRFAAGPTIGLLIHQRLMVIFISIVKKRMDRGPINQGMPISEQICRMRTTILEAEEHTQTAVTYVCQIE